MIIRRALTCVFKGTLHILSSPFCQGEEKQLKDSKKEKAKIAAQIIRLLASQPPIKFLASQPPANSEEKTAKTIFDAPLSKLVIKKLQDKKAFSDPSLQFFKRAFDPLQGVGLPDYLKLQSRIINGMNSNENFPFFPNKLVTTEVFQVLFRFNSKTLLFGPPGISKTVAIILYTYLASLITQYEFSYNDVVAKDVPRLIYLSYDGPYFKGGAPQDDRKNILEGITSQIKAQLPASLNSKIQNIPLKEIYTEIKNAFKQKGLTVKIIFDQFNTYVSECEDYNRLVRAKQLSPEIAKIFRTKIEIQHQYWIAAPLFTFQNKVLFNSSLNVRGGVLNTSTKFQFGLDLNHHEKLRKIHIDFFQKLSNLEGKKEIFRIIFFQLKRVLGNKSLADKIQKIETTIMKKFNEAIGVAQVSKVNKKIEAIEPPVATKANNNTNEKPNTEKEVSTSFISRIEKIKLTQLDIRSSLSENKQVWTQKLLNVKQQPQQKIDQNSAEDFMVEVLQSIGGIYLVNIDDLVEKFCKEGGDNLSFSKILLLFTIRGIILEKQVLPENIEVKEIRDKGFKLDISEEIIDKNLLRMNFFQDKKTLHSISSKLSRDEFLKATRNVDNYLFDSIGNNFRHFTDLFLPVLEKGNAVLGTFLDKLIILCLQKYLPAVKFDQCIYNFGRLETFLHFNAGKGTLPLEDRLGKILSNQSIKYTLGLPTTLANKQSPISQSFDLLVAVLDQDKNYVIKSVDFTVGRTLDYIDGKKKSSENLIGQIFKDYYGKGLPSAEKPKIVRWNHHIVGVKMQPYEKNFEANLGSTFQKAKCSVKTIEIKDFVLINQNQQVNEHMELFKLIVDSLYN